MIAVTRSSKPTILIQKEKRWLAALQQAATKNQKENAANHYRHPEIKAALDSMFHGKCAYCESKINHVTYAHIEHYRPKSNPAFSALTFDWDNLLLACGICNSSAYKGDKFPLVNQGGPYINPCTDDPAKHFKFVYDHRAKIASVYGKTRRGTITEKDLGLNRPELRTYRSTLITRLAYIASKAQSDPVAKQLLEEAQ